MSELVADLRGTWTAERLHKSPLLHLVLAQAADLLASAARTPQRQQIQAPQS
jgi:hypothetical protein